MSGGAKYFIVEAEAMPEIIRKVAEAKRLLETGEKTTVNGAAREVGISRSAFYKYKDAVHPFQDMLHGRIVTLQTVLRDEPGVLSGVTMVFIPSVSTFVISRLLGGKDETDCAEAVERFLKSIDLNCKLRELGVEEYGIDWMTDNCINVFAGSMRNHTKALTRDEVKQIYLEAF